MKKLNSALVAILMVFLLFGQTVLAATELPFPVEPRVKAKAAIAYDLTNDEIILEKNMDERMYPASITKLMTALLLAENANREDDLYISEIPLKVPGFAINKNLFKLYKGDTITADAAMKAILLPSANDMAVVAAEHVGKTVEGFSDLMNDKAQELGMVNTHFMNPTGLHDPLHYTTAADLMKLVRAAYANDWVREIIATDTANIRTKWQKVGDIKNSNQLLGKDGNVGGKTGFTPEAGRCLVGIYQREGREMIQILLHSGTTLQSNQVFTDMTNLTEEAFELEKIPMIEKNTPVDSITAEYKLFRWFGPIKTVHIKASTKDDLLFYNNTINNDQEGLTPVVKPLAKLDVFQLKEGMPIGDLSLTKGGHELSTKVLSQTNTLDSVIIPNAVPYLGVAIGGFLVIVLFLFLLIKLIRSRKSTQRKIRSRRTQKRRRNAKNPYSDKI